MDLFAHGLDFLLRGGWIMYPLFFLAITSVAVIIERFISIRKAAVDTEELLRQIRTHLEGGRVQEAQQLCERTPGPVAALLANGIRNRHLSNAEIERAMEELALRETP